MLKRRIQYKILCYTVLFLPRNFHLTMNVDILHIIIIYGENNKTIVF